MSFDVWLEIDTGGDEPAQVVDDLNMTSNVAPMWRRAGADLAEFDGRAAGDVLPMLQAAIAAMEADPETYRAMNPPNRWGDFDSCLSFLRRLRQEFTSHPKTTVRVWS